MAERFTIPPENRCEPLGLVIAEIREKKGMTQTDVGVAFNVSLQQISKWEANNEFPRYFKRKHALKMLDVLSCTVDEQARLMDAFYCFVVYGYGDMRLEDVQLKR